MPFDSLLGRLFMLNSRENDVAFNLPIKETFFRPHPHTHHDQPWLPSLSSSSSFSFHLQTAHCTTLRCRSVVPFLQPPQNECQVKVHHHPLQITRLTLDLFDFNFRQLTSISHPNWNNFIFDCLTHRLFWVRLGHFKAVFPSTDFSFLFQSSSRPSHLPRSSSFSKVVAFHFITAIRLTCPCFTFLHLPFVTGLTVKDHHHHHQFCCAKLSKKKKEAAKSLPCLFP